MRKGDILVLILRFTYEPIMSIIWQKDLVEDVWPQQI